MPEMYAGGIWDYLPFAPLTREMSRHVSHPFILLSAVVFLLSLGRQRVWWSRTMTALLLASMVFYVLAEIFFMNLYLPNRYTRYSMAVLLALWHAGNWDRVLERIPRRSLRILLLVSVLGLGAALFTGTFRIGEDTSLREEWAPLNRFIATLPKKVLIAGHPCCMDDIPIQARRSVLCNFRMAHPWYSDYYREIRQRTEATFDALYAAEPGPVNRLAREWGVTHLVVVKRDLSSGWIKAGKFYAAPYNDYIARVALSNRRFLLSKPPRRSIVYEDRGLFVIELPIGEPDSSENVSGSPVNDPSHQGER
jgi:hypothetical protein